MRFQKKTIVIFLITALTTHAFAQQDGLSVNTDNFVRAESDLYFKRIVEDGGFGQFNHNRNFPELDKQIIIRLNRDTLYSSVVVDLEAGPVVINVPDAGERFLSIQVINEDHYTTDLIHKPGAYTLDRESVGTRYALIGVRIFVNSQDPEDISRVNKIQDQLGLTQKEKGHFIVPEWDLVSQNKVRTNLIELAALLPNTDGMFGEKEKVDPIKHLLGSAFAWGGNPEKEATYLNIVPKENDGKTPYQLVIDDVPVKGFWSISVYDENGYYKKNELDIYTLNSANVKKAEDGKIYIQFGDCTNSSINCIPIMKGWNYMVRLYQPEQSILDKKWNFPVATVLNKN